LIWGATTTCPENKTTNFRERAARVQHVRVHII